LPLSRLLLLSLRIHLPRFARFVLAQTRYVAALIKLGAEIQPRKREDKKDKKERETYIYIYIYIYIYRERERERERQ